MPTEADTCHTMITPKLQAAGWGNDPHCIPEQCRIISELDALQNAMLPALIDRACKGEC